MQMCCRWWFVVTWFPHKCDSSQQSYKDFEEENMNFKLHPTPFIHTANDRRVCRCVCRVLFRIRGWWLWREDVHGPGHSSCGYCWAAGQVGAGHQPAGQGAAQSGMSTQQQHATTTTCTMGLVRPMNEGILFRKVVRKVSEPHCGPQVKMFAHPWLR